MALCFTPLFELMSLPTGSSRLHHKPVVSSATIVDPPNLTCVIMTIWGLGFFFCDPWRDANVQMRPGRWEGEIGRWRWGGAGSRRSIRPGSGPWALSDRVMGACGSTRSGGVFVERLQVRRSAWEVGVGVLQDS
ncbi:hypothetical protein SCP_1800690 [Sparassis crispa]|uniref:Uncharacterized protein n=1 Tax=Sparassis crispa TaxID=139825 RepID=A0A401H6H8_9APHY|nr:hypothetical protein SCP_1800690 [Sparassis crispa]GBE90047.1 hypothetical protein SCP_1800690 [Sparassis crispa]